MGRSLSYHTWFLSCCMFSPPLPSKVPWSTTPTWVLVTWSMPPSQGAEAPALDDSDVDYALFKIVQQRRRVDTWTHFSAYFTLPELIKVCMLWAVFIPPPHTHLF